MQQIVVIDSHFGELSEFSPWTVPKVNGLLKQGWKVVNFYPVMKDNTTNQVLVVIEKDDSKKV